jgi:hypothetical protein
MLSASLLRVVSLYVKEERRLAQCACQMTLIENASRIPISQKTIARLHSATSQHSALRFAAQSPSYLLALSPSNSSASGGRALRQTMFLAPPATSAWPRRWIIPFGRASLNRDNSSRLLV